MTQWQTYFPFAIPLIENQVQDLPGHYYQTHPEALYTLPEDYLALFAAVPDCETWVELGSGLGLGPLMFGTLYPKKKTIGVEFEKARFKAAVEMREEKKLTNVSFLCEDLLESKIPMGDVYFLYFPTGHVFDRILSELGNLTHPFKIIAIESHGDLFSRLSLESWLEVAQEVPLVSERYHTHARIYQVTGVRCPLFFDRSFKDHEFLLREEDGREWLGDSYGMEWEGGDLFNLKHPPRTINSSQIIKVGPIERLDDRALFLVKLRRLGECRFKTLTGIHQGFIRKIVVGPTFSLELSSGRQVKWDEIDLIYWENYLCYDSSSCLYSLPHAALES